MGPVFYVMAILGCADSESACHEVRLTQAHYASADACAAATDGALESVTDLDYPVVTARCRQAEARLAVATVKPRG